MGTGRVRVRAARDSDVPALCALLRPLVLALVPDPDGPEAASFLAGFEAPAIAERIAAPHYLHLVAERDSGLLGYIALRDGTHLFHLFVAREVQRRGIARLLWRHLLAATDATRLTVNSAPSAVPVYRRFGFVPRGEAPGPHGPPCVPMVYVRNRAAR